MINKILLYEMMSPERESRLVVVNPKLKQQGLERGLSLLYGCTKRKSGGKTRCEELEGQRLGAPLCSDEVVFSIEEGQKGEGEEKGLGGHPWERETKRPLARPVLTYRFAAFSSRERAFGAWGETIRWDRFADWE